MDKEQEKLNCPANPQSTPSVNIQKEPPTTDPLQSFRVTLIKMHVFSACSTLTTFPHYSDLPASPFMTWFQVLLSAFKPPHHLWFLSATFLSHYQCPDSSPHHLSPFETILIFTDPFIFSLVTRWSSFHTPQHYNRTNKWRKEQSNKWLDAHTHAQRNEA